MKTAQLVIMVVGILKIGLHIEGNKSLKGKRRILLRIKEGVKSKFNVSVAEIDSLDKWQTAHLGIAIAGAEAPFINSCLDKVLNYIEELNIAEVRSHEIEIINL